MAPLAVILLVVQNSILSDRRSSILRAAGYKVRHAISIKQAIREFRAGDLDLVLLCNSISPQDKDRMTSLIRASGLHIPVISVATVDAAFEKLLYAVQLQLLKSPKRHRPQQTNTNDSLAAFKLQRTILSVDDDPNFLLFRRMLLEKAGYTVLTAQAGSEGLKIFSTGTVDAVILDYSMPEMNGAVIAARMRRLKSEVPLILCSGSLRVPTEDLALFDRVIPKGVSPDLLLKTLDEVWSSVRRRALAPARSRAAS